LFALLVLSRTSPTRAAETRLGAATIAYQVRDREDDRCPTEAEFVGTVLAALAAEPTAANTSASRIEVSLEVIQSGAVGTLVSRPLDGSTPLVRSVRAAKCREVAEALSVVLVQSIDPLASQDRSPPPREPQPPSASKRESRPREPSPRKPQPRAPREPMRYGLSLAVGAAAGPTPRITPSLGVGAVARLPTSLPLEIRLGVGALLPSSVALGGGVVQFWAASGRLEVCSTPQITRSVALGGCVGAAVDGVVTRSRGYREPKTTTAAIPAVTAGILGRFALTRAVSIGLSTEIAPVLTPTTWALTDGRVVHKTEPVSARCSSFVQVNFL
jgi:hypothetical protein